MDISNKPAPGPVDKAAVDETGYVAFVGALRWAFTLYAEVARAGGGYVSTEATEKLIASAWRAYDGMCGAELDEPIASALHGGRQ